MLTRRFLLLSVLLAVLSPAMSGTARSEGPKRYQRSVESYTTPDVTLVNQDGRKVRLQEILTGNKPVMLDFIYGTCTTICPVLSAGFSNLQRKLGPAAQDVRLVSITIDPEHDSPEVMSVDHYRSRA
jgi:protein SCO1/2